MPRRLVACGVRRYQDVVNRFAFRAVGRTVCGMRLTIITIVLALGALTACGPLDPTGPLPAVKIEKPHSTPASGKPSVPRTPCESCTPGTK